MITVETLGSSSSGNCYRLLAGGRSLLMECGLAWSTIREKLNFETTRLDGVLISHEHGDHGKAAKKAAGSAIKIFASTGTLEALGLEGHHRSTALRDKKPVVINNHWKIVPFKTIHDCQEPLGFQVDEILTGDRLVFITDTAYCTYTFSGINILMIEANYCESILASNVEGGSIDRSRAIRTRENHLSIERVIEFLGSNDLSRCREIRLLHLSSSNSHAADFKRQVMMATGIPTYIEG